MQRGVDVRPERCSPAVTIADVPALVESLPPIAANLWQRFFRIDSAIGSLIPPERMHAWIERAFGTVDAVVEQHIIRITNVFSLEGAIFNRIRSQRPQQGRYHSNIDEIIAANAGSNDTSGFATPESGTPEDPFGRIRGRYCITASNIAKFDGWHGVLVFDQHHPLNFTRERIEDYLQTAWRWFETVHSHDRQAVYPFFLWNCLWRSGASVIHGHAQMAVAQGMAYPRVEALRRVTEHYYHTYDQAYFDDLWKVHRLLGLAFGRPQDRTRGYVSLTPIKEKEVVLLSSDPDDLAQQFYQVLDCFVAELGVQSFNVSLILPPLTSTSESWEHMPLIMRIVDRGDPNSRGSDIGTMELYAASVVASDPFDIIRALSGRLPVEP